MSPESVPPQSVQSQSVKAEHVKAKSLQLSHAQIQQFKIDGYLILPSLLSPTDCQQLVSLTQQHLNQRIEPFELEAQLQYPGAPASTSAKGGSTIRRLLHAFERDEAFSNWAKHPTITGGIQQILSNQNLLLNPNHHNCVMTKQPQYSSETLWHRDTRYWQFNDKYLINAWIALGDEHLANGAMKVLPGSHRWDVAEQALDELQFLKTDQPDNQQRLATQRVISLNAGDVLLFSAHCFHAAGKNTTTDNKFSLVFTYHGENTKAIDNTPSAKLKPIPLLA